jgi:hypothetical protein
VQSHGFALVRKRRNRWRGTFNFDLSMAKRHTLSRAECEGVALAYLRQFLVDDTPGELRLLNTWMELYARQIARTWASDG